jgi:hypothetical protein
MATWHEVESVVQLLPSKKLNDTLWALDLSIYNSDRTQQVFVAYEVIQPDMEFVTINSPLAQIRCMNMEAIVRNFGALNIGSLSYVPFDEDDGMLCIGTNLPLSILDLSQREIFLTYLSVLAKAADTIRIQIL